MVWQAVIPGILHGGQSSWIVYGYLDHQPTVESKPEFSTRTKAKAVTLFSIGESKPQDFYGELVTTYGPVEAVNKSNFPVGQKHKVLQDADQY